MLHKVHFRFGFQENYTKSWFYTIFTDTKSSIDCTWLGKTHWNYATTWYVIERAFWSSRYQLKSNKPSWSCKYSSNLEICKLLHTSFWCTLAIYLFSYQSRWGPSKFPRACQFQKLFKYAQDTPIWQTVICIKKRLSFKRFSVSHLSLQIRIFWREYDQKSKCSIMIAVIEIFFSFHIYVREISGLNHINFHLENNDFIHIQLCVIIVPICKVSLFIICSSLWNLGLLF